MGGLSKHLNPFSGSISDNLNPFSGGSKSAEKAGKIQEESTRKALDFQRESLEQIRSDLAPFVDVGETAGGKLFSAVQDPSARVLNNPFFKALSQDQQNRLSGTAGLDMGGEVFDRNLLLAGNQLAQQDINNLTDLTALGQASAAQVGAQAGDSASLQSQLLEQGGAAAAAGEIGRGNAIAQAGQQGIGILGAFLSDVRLKEDITPAGTRNGVNYYFWKWTEEALKFVGDQIGFGALAQEVMYVNPDAVIIDADGWFRVDYSRLV